MNTNKLLRTQDFVFAKSLLLLLFFSFSTPLFSQNADLDLLLASDGLPYNIFGCELSLSEDYLVVGSSDSGQLESVYVYSKDIDGIWGNEQKINLPQIGPSIYGGHSVSVSENTIVVGSPLDEEQGFRTGAAHVYEVDGNGQWNYKQKLMADNATPDLRFGRTVYASPDHIAIASYGATSVEGYGSVHIFEKDNTGNWYFTQKIEEGPNDVSNFSPFRFGISISIYDNHIAIGNEGYSEPIYGQGSVHIYKKNTNGIWENESIITAPDGMEWDRFGYSVSLYENTLVAGAPDTDEFGLSSGSVYIYELDANGNWNIEKKIVTPEEKEYEFFGTDVQLHKNRFIVGSRNNIDGYTGAAYTYIKTEGSEWIAEETYIAFDASYSDSFGRRVGLNSNSIVIAAQGHDGIGENAGAVYVQEVDCSFSLECPEDLIIETNAGICEGLAAFDDATLIPDIIDGCGGINISQISGPVINESIEVGSYEISFKAVSSEGISDNCTFSIEVVDNEAPTALCQDLEFLLDPCAEVSVQAEEVDFGSSDACGIASYNLSQTFFDESFIGTNPVELTVRDIHGNTATCNASITIEAGIQIDASALISPENITMSYGEPLELSPSIANMDELIFSWYVDGALYCTDCYSISMYPASNAIIELRVEDIEGCFSYSDAVGLQLLVDYSVHIPTVFSPNYDGINDHFQAYFTNGVKPAYELQIRDRWGNIVYHQKGEQIGWDGQFRGEEAAEGIYTYALVFSLVNGEEVVEMGDVCLVR